MAILSSKWAIAGLIILCVFVLLLIIGRKNAHAEIIIEASPKQVWSVLTDFSNVKKWNKVLVPLEGDLQENNTIKYEFYQEEGGKGAIMDAIVKQLVSERLLNQQGGMWLILTFDHKYILTSAEAETRVTIHEEYRGIMVPFWNPAPVEKSYERLLAQLKNRVENNL